MFKPFDIYVIGIASAFGVCSMLLYGMLTPPHTLGNITQPVVGFLIGLYMLTFIMRIEMGNVGNDNRLVRMGR